MDISINKASKEFIQQRFNEWYSDKVNFCPNIKYEPCRNFYPVKFLFYRYNCHSLLSSKYLCIKTDYTHFQVLLHTCSTSTQYTCTTVFSLITSSTLIFNITHFFNLLLQVSNATFSAVPLNECPNGISTDGQLIFLDS